MARTARCSQQLFFWATDPSQPDEDPGWPGPLELPVKERIDQLGRTIPLEYDPAIAAEVRAARLAVQREQVVEDAVTGHQRLTRLKLAGLFAMIDDRLHVTPDDWDLAGQIVDTSNRIRIQMKRQGVEQLARANVAKGAALGERQLAADEVVQRRQAAAVVEKAEQIRAWVADGPRPRQELRKRARRWRPISTKPSTTPRPRDGITRWEESGQGESRQMVGPPGPTGGDRDTSSCCQGWGRWRQSPPSVDLRTGVHITNPLSIKVCVGRYFSEICERRVGTRPDRPHPQLTARAPRGAAEFYRPSRRGDPRPGPQRSGSSDPPTPSRARPSRGRGPEFFDDVLAAGPRSRRIYI